MDKKILYRKIGSRIYERRKELGLTQNQLADLMNVTPQMISNAENGIKGIRPENIVKFSETLNLSCNYLLTGISDNYDFNKH